MILVGADPGLKGALVALNADARQVVSVLPMPHLNGDIDWARVDDWLGEAKPALLVCERVHAFPIGSRKSAFSFGRNYGGIITLAITRRLPYELVMPQTWQDEILRDWPHKNTKADRGATKRASVAYCDRAYPGTVPRTAKGKADDGVADALCLAEYGRRHFVALA